MRMTAARMLLVLGAATLPWSSAWAGPVSGTVMLGGVVMDQEGDRTAVQETSNIYDGFSLSQIRLNGTLHSTDAFTLDLSDLTLGSRRGEFVYRWPGLFRLNAGFDQYREMFAPDGAANSHRRDWRLGAEYAAAPWLRFSGNLDYVSHFGDRLAYPAGTLNTSGDRFDNAMTTGQVTAEAHHGGTGGAIAYQASGFNDNIDGSGDRTGQLVSARFHAPCRFYDRWTHLVRGAYGVRRLSNRDVEYRLSTFRYSGVVTPVSRLEFRYNFDASRVNDEATALRTDRVQNSVDLTSRYRFGQIGGGYAYETNDDDRTLTRYHGWRANTVFHLQNYVTARVEYAGRNKNDQEDLTLLKDIESNRLRARLEVRPVDAVTVGGGYSRRAREFTDIGVTAVGNEASGFARCTRAGWGAVSADYSYSTDTYHDRAAGFDARSSIVTGRIDLDRVRNLMLGCGVTYLDIGRDLDIEKSMIFAEGTWMLPRNYRVQVKYNVYNYDDYILLDRYYTANVLWINVGFDFNLK